MTDTLPHGLRADAATWNAAPAPVREIILRHAADASQIQHLFDIEQHLIEEVHQKKSAHRNARYKPFSSVQHHYDVTLFKKRASISSRDVFPASFKNAGEDQLYAELDAYDLLIILLLGNPAAGSQWKQHCLYIYHNLPHMNTTAIRAWDLEAIGDRVSQAEEDTFQTYLERYRAMFEKYSALGNPVIIKEHRRLARIFGWAAPAMPRTWRR